MLARYVIALCIVVAGGCCSSDPNAKYRDAQMRVGMTIKEIKEQFGEPDSYREGYNNDGTGTMVSDTRMTDYEYVANTRYRYHVENLGYGPFGAHNQRVGHITKYRLDLTFVDGKLLEWEKGAPVESE